MVSKAVISLTLQIIVDQNSYIRLQLGSRRSSKYNWGQDGQYGDPPGHHGDQLIRSWMEGKKAKQSQVLGARYHNDLYKRASYPITRPQPPRLLRTRGDPGGGKKRMLPILQEKFNIIYLPGVLGSVPIVLFPVQGNPFIQENPFLSKEASRVGGKIGLCYFPQLLSTDMAGVAWQKADILEHLVTRNELAETGKRRRPGFIILLHAAFVISFCTATLLGTCISSFLIFKLDPC